MKFEEKICKDCRHCQHIKPSFFASLFLDKVEKYYCLRNLRIIESRDKVTGHIIVETYGKTYCERERQSILMEDCGYSGKYWEPKE